MCFGTEVQVGTAENHRPSELPVYCSINGHGRSIPVDRLPNFGKSVNFDDCIDAHYVHHRRNCGAEKNQEK